MKRTTPTSQRRPKSGARPAFTLLETVVATALFVALAAGVLGVTVMSRRSMNQALMRNTAFDAAQGFLDQIKGGVTFGTLLQVMPTPAGPAVPGTRDKNGKIIAATPAIPAQPGGTITVTGIGIGQNSTAAQPVELKAHTPDSNKYTDYKLPLNSTDATDKNALSGVAFVPSYGLKFELTALDDTTVTGTSNAVLVTLRFRYKYRPGDSDYKAGSVSYIAPRTSL
jgi:type II secretory pathway pseudopilin PulG